MPINRVNTPFYDFSLVSRTTHSTCHDTSEMMSNGEISLKSVLGKLSDVGFCAWEEVGDDAVGGINLL